MLLPNRFRRKWNFKNLFMWMLVVEVVSLREVIHFITKLFFWPGSRYVSFYFFHFSNFLRRQGSFNFLKTRKLTFFSLPGNLFTALAEKRWLGWIWADNVRSTIMLNGTWPFHSNGFIVRRHPSVSFCIVAAEKWSRFPSKIRAV